MYPIICPKHHDKPVQGETLVKTISKLTHFQLDELRLMDIDYLW